MNKKQSIKSAQLPAGADGKAFSSLPGRGFRPKRFITDSVRLHDTINKNKRLQKTNLWNTRSLFKLLFSCQGCMQVSF